MNVNISYAVNFDELPLEVKKLLEEVRISVDNAMLDDFEEARGEVKVISESH